MKIRAKRKTPELSLPNEMISVRSLKTYHKNPRRGNIEKVAESLKGNGQFKPILVNRGSKTGRENEILAGNHTFLAARKLGWPEIWVSWVDLDENAAKKIVVADNGSTDDASYDDQILMDLLSEIKAEEGDLIGTTYTDDALDDLVKTIQIGVGDINKIEDAPEDLPGVASLDNNVIFSSGIDYEIPELMDDMILAEPPKKLDIWAGHELDLPRQEANPDMWWLGLWHSGMMKVNWSQVIPCFYTEDFHFDPVFYDPAKNTKKILNLGISVSMMPNYSVNPGWPVATWIWSLYRSFYIGRYFQEAGITVIPDLMFGGDDEVLDISLQGIPKGAGTCGLQLQNIRGDKDKVRFSARMLDESYKRIGFKHLIVYGHNDADDVLDRASLPSSVGVVRIKNRTARRREYLQGENTINSANHHTLRVKKKAT